MDEVDGMSGSAERGGMMDLIETIKLSKIPIICICNDAYNTKVSPLAFYFLICPVKTNSVQKAICVMGVGLRSTPTRVFWNKLRYQTHKF